jgi:hypothetical protein
MKALLSLVCAGLLVSAHLHAAQTAPATPETAVTPAPAAAATPAAAPVATSATAPLNGKYELHDGDDITLKFAQDLSSKTATEGDSVNFVLDGDVKVGDVVVIKSGTKAVGEVTNAKRAGMMGKGGELSVRIDYIRVGETKVRLRGAKGKEGASGTTSAVVLTVLFGPIGLIKHGHEIDIKEGSALKVFLDDNTFLPPV